MVPRTELVCLRGNEHLGTEPRLKLRFRASLSDQRAIVFAPLYANDPESDIIFARLTR